MQYNQMYLRINIKVAYFLNLKFAKIKIIFITVKVKGRIYANICFKYTHIHTENSKIKYFVFKSFLTTKKENLQESVSIVFDKVMTHFSYFLKFIISFV